MTNFTTWLIAASLAVWPTSLPAQSKWTAATPDVTTAAKEPRIAAVLAEIEKLDRALVTDDHKTFADAMAPDLIVNNPGNIVATRGMVTKLNADGRIAYTSYERIIEYAGLRGDLVLLTGEERVVAKPPNPLAGREVRRRFTDLWQKQGGRWLLTARQATVISP